MTTVDSSNGEAETKPAAALPAHVGVLGGGRMGAGIAHAFLISGSRVSVVERNDEEAEAARTRVLDSVAASIKRGLAAEADELASRLSVTTDAAVFAGVGLAIEAVPENLELKLSSLARVEAELASDAVLASNTSSIPITQLAESLSRPAQFIGMHFFNPVPSSSLVELVRHTGVSEALLATANDWVRALGKTAITVSDSPGFASSRLGITLALEAIRMVEQGVASPEDIDLAMQLGYRHPTGPLRTSDMVGLDVRLGIAEELERELGERFSPPQLLRDMVARGDLGRKTGQGFYNWTHN